MRDAHDPIPVNAISLMDAYQRTLEGTEPGLVQLLDDIERHPLVHIYPDHPENELIAVRNQTAREKWNMYEQAARRANKQLRRWITDGALTAHVRDPEHAEILQLPRSGWEETGMLGEVTDNFVSPDDPFNPGPPEATDRSGRRLPVFFWEKDFGRLLAKLHPLPLHEPPNVNEPDAGLANDLPAANAVYSGRGKMKRAIQDACKTLFPSGIPPGLSSQSRDDRIIEYLKQKGEVSSVPVSRTIQRALKEL